MLTEVTLFFLRVTFPWSAVPFTVATAENRAGQLYTKEWCHYFQSSVRTEGQLLTLWSNTAFMSSFEEESINKRHFA